MNTHIILNRFAGVPSYIGINRANYIHHWHLHQLGEPIDAQIKEPDKWGKGAYPVNFDGLRERTGVARLNQSHRNNGYASGQPLVLEMEVGQRVFDYRDDRDRLALAHIGKVVRALGGVDCVYGHGWGFQVGWNTKPDDSELWKVNLANDLAAYTLYGCPDRLAVTMYGKWSHRWLPDRAHRIERARRLADAITYKPVKPVLFISPFVADEGDMYLDHWRWTCDATRFVCNKMDADTMIWWDGGPDRRPYEYARPYVEAAKEVLCE